MGSRRGDDCPHLLSDDSELSAITDRVLNAYLPVISLSSPFGCELCNNAQPARADAAVELNQPACICTE